MFMQSFWKCWCSFYYAGVVVTALMFLLGCKDTDNKSEQPAVNPKVTNENFAKIKQDMSFKEVHDFLGGSEVLRVDENSVTENGKVSGRAIEVRRWRDGDSWIVVTFNFGKVVDIKGNGLR
jgi:hypothetical protein